MMTAELKPPNKATHLYETDFHAWIQEQVQLLKTGDLGDLDVTNLVEELEALGRQERQELTNRLGVLLGHLLKWEFQPEARSKSWFATIREQRRRLNRLIQKNPSLKPYLTEAREEAFPDGVDLVVRETPLTYTELPPQCPYSLEQLFDDKFLPGLPFENLENLLGSTEA